MYNKILGPNEVNTNVTYAHARILPKSNMVGTSIFFRVYHDLLHGKKIDDSQLYYKKIDINLFGKKCFSLYHGSCPGFPPKDIDPKLLALWRQQSFYTAGWDPLDDIKKNINFNMLINNKEFLNSCKIVFIFRNPLDYLVSYHRHQWHSVTDNHKYKTNKSASNLSLEEFTFDEGALGSWVKQFFTYHILKDQYPDMILLVPYEEIINDRYSSLQRIINHLGIPFDEEAFSKAIEITSIENMRQVENRSGKSLSQDQRLASERHIRDGSIGGWQSKMSVELVSKIESFMNDFELSLKMFHLADELDAKFSFVSNEQSLMLPAFTNEKTSKDEVDDVDDYSNVLHPAPGV